MLAPTSPRQIEYPEDLLMLCRSSKDGIVFGVENWNTPEGRLEVGYDKYGERRSCSEFQADLDYLHVVAAREKWVHFRKWIHKPQTCGYEDYRCTMDQFQRPGFRGDVEASYALTLDWYAPKGWKSALMMLAACVDE